MRRNPLRLGRLLSAALLFCIPPAVSAATPDYVDAVTADLNEFSSGKFDTPSSSDWLGSQQGAADGTASMEDFEAFVKSKFRGTYILFVRLSASQKHEIWQDYVATGDLGGIRSNIYAARRNKGSKQRSSLNNLPLDF